MKARKKIVFLTGTRADFGKLKPLIRKVEDSGLFDCYIFVTGMHTLSKYGPTYLEVQKENFKNVFIFMNQTHTTDSDVILSNTITGFSNFVKEIKPDMIVIHGDRIEPLGGAVVGAFNNILTAHIEGGEITGTIDEIIRHSITKLSHVHLVSNDKAKKRLLQMGESDKTIFVIGSPDIDIMMSNKLPTFEELKKRYNINFEKYAILLFHSVTTELEDLKQHIENLVSCTIESKKNFVVIYPNNDSGSNIILQEYNRFKDNDNFQIFPSMRFEYFLSLLKHADFIIGNSSAGIREAVVFGIPCINLGSRQRNRSDNTMIKNIQTNQNEIFKAIIESQDAKLNPSFEFGHGNSANLFFEIIKKEEFWNTPIQKQFVDLSPK